VVWHNLEAQGMGAGSQDAAGASWRVRVMPWWLRASVEFLLKSSIVNRPGFYCAVFFCHRCTLCLSPFVKFPTCVFLWTKIIRGLCVMSDVHFVLKVFLSLSIVNWIKLFIMTVSFVCLITTSTILWPENT
jgi:hypothetical protein